MKGWIFKIQPFIFPIFKQFALPIVLSKEEYYYHFTNYLNLYLWKRIRKE
jgi:hypothetical protein